MCKNYRITIAVSLFLLTASLFASVSARPAAMRDMSTQEIVLDMGLGINLGNTLEAIAECIGLSPTDSLGCWYWTEGMAEENGGTYETAWGSPRLERSMVAGYKNYGFNTVRVPVAWSNRMIDNRIGGTYTINPDLMNRVQEVVDWILDEGMYVILNIHYDGPIWNGERLRDGNGNDMPWWSKFATDSTNAMDRYTKIWEQISERFRDYGDKLVFAALNEEGIWQEVWDRHNNTGDKARAYGLLRAINQQFVNVVRSSGGNNADRHLQVQGYATDIDRTVDEAFQMPIDPRPAGTRLALSVHYYDPFAFTHLSEAVDWGGIIHPMLTWGTPEDYEELNTKMDKLVDRFVSRGVPVIIGEYGYACSFGEGDPWQRDMAEIRRYTHAVTEAIFKRNMAPMLWDVQLNESSQTWDGQPRKPEIIYYYERYSGMFRDQQMGAGFVTIAASERDELVVSVKRDDHGRVRSPAIARPNVSVRGRTLNVSSPVNADMRVKLIDTRGRVRASFNAQGRGSFSLAKITAGRYFVEVRGAGIRQTTPVIVK